MIYYIKDTAVVFSWNDADVASDNSLTNCGPLTWEITAEDGITLIDSSIFTLDQSSRTINVHTDDF